MGACRRVPCAHAPALAALDIEPDLSPRACAEELGHTFLPCVLTNLGRAPTLLDGTERPIAGDLWQSDLDAIVVPVGACGGPGVMALMGTDTLIIGVEENAGTINVTTQALHAPGVAVVRSYMEAIGLLAAHKAGVNPACLTSDIASIRELELPPSPVRHEQDPVSFLAS